MHLILLRTAVALYDDPFTKFQDKSVLPEYAPLPKFIVSKHLMMIGCDRLYVGAFSQQMPGGGLSWMGTRGHRRALEAGVSTSSIAHETYPGSGLSGEITPLVLLCGVFA